MHPFITLGPRIQLDSWTVMMTLAFVAGCLVALNALRERLGLARALVLVLLMVWGALFGAHLAHLLFHWGSFSGRHLESLLTFWRDGHSFFGALAFCGLLLLLCSRVFPGLDLWTTADAFALGAPLGLSLARVGCYLKGCCWGIPIADGHPLHGLSYQLIDNHYTALHPVQLYSAASALAIFVVLLGARTRQRVSGTLLGLLGLLYGCARFFLEFYRGDTGSHSLFLESLSVHQGICLVLVPASALFLYLRLSGRSKGFRSESRTPDSGAA